MHERALEAYDVLAAGGVPARTHAADPFLALFRRERDMAPFVRELEHIRDAGQQVAFDPIIGWAVRAMEPVVTEDVHSAAQIHGQRYLQPPEYLRALAGAVRARGGEV